MKGLTGAVFSALNDDHIRECQMNCEMMQRVVDALNIVSPALKSFVYSGGTRVRRSSPSQHYRR